MQRAQGCDHRGLSPRVSYQRGGDNGIRLSRRVDEYLAVERRERMPDNIAEQVRHEQELVEAMGDAGGSPPKRGGSGRAFRSPRNGWRPPTPRTRIPLALAPSTCATR